jgi:hemerythrin
MTTEAAAKKKPFVIEWRKGFEVNIRQIDHEHEHLFALIKALSLQSMDRTLEELLEYVVVHFTNEQELMEKSGYPGFAQHLQLHENFASHVADFLGNGEPWNEERVQELRRFLNKWLVGHIMTHDLRFGKWYEENVRANPPATPAAHIDPRVQLAQFRAAREQAARMNTVAVPPQKTHRGLLSLIFGKR